MHGRQRGAAKQGPGRLPALWDDESSDERWRTRRSTNAFAHSVRTRIGLVAIATFCVRYSGVQLNNTSRSQE